MMTAFLLLFALFASNEPYESTRENCLERDGQWTPEGCWLWEGDLYVLVEAADEEAVEPVGGPEVVIFTKAEIDRLVAESTPSVSPSARSTPQTTTPIPSGPACNDPCDYDGPYGQIDVNVPSCIEGYYFDPITCGMSFNEWVATSGHWGVSP